jgi:4-hydroxyproline epimerase
MPAVENHPPLRIQIIDSHTAGEPTRCVIAGSPDLGDGPLHDRLELMRSRYDIYRRAILCEPRGSDVLVGALLVPPVNPAAAAGVIFFNNTGYLGMCGHGMIGIATTLKHLGRIAAGEHLIETPVGEVRVTLHPNGEVTIANVPAYRHLAHVPVTVPGHGTIYGDVAWGGNWFFLIGDHPFTLDLQYVDQLTSFTAQVRHDLAAQGITGANGSEIDHIELFSDAHDPTNHSRNFVLCPGNAYDRSPCGTGTSAKLACLYADLKLQPGQPWRQEGILGSVFVGYIQRDRVRLIPHITGSAYVTAESTLIFSPDDPFRDGIPGVIGTRT